MSLNTFQIVAFTLQCSCLLGKCIHLYCSISLVRVDVQDYYYVCKIPIENTGVICMQEKKKPVYVFTVVLVLEQT